jgi:cell division septal protein FtsQ
MHRSFFRVQHVVVVGVHHENVEAVEQASGLLAHPAMLGLSSASVAKNLRRFDWITGVSLIKKWPNTVTLDVKETSAVGVAFTSAHQLMYVGAEGQNLGPAPLKANLPTLSYLNPTKTTWPFARAGRNAATVASALPPAFSSQVSTISVGAEGNVKIGLTTPVTFLLGRAIDLHAKFVAIASVISGATLRAGDVVNVEVPEELSVQGPTPG